jgi:hypothetical protein
VGDRSKMDWAQSTAGRLVLKSHSNVDSNTTEPGVEVIYALECLKDYEVDLLDYYEGWIFCCILMICSSDNNL